MLLPQGNGGMPDTELELLYHPETKLMDVSWLSIAGLLPGGLGPAIEMHAGGSLLLQVHGAA